MRIGDLVRRPAPGEATGLDKIPWHEPGFSRRMLAEHLSQAHDWASRRADIIARQVEHLAALLPPAGGRVLDLGCGPGLYSHRLAQRGHACVGVDFSPAAIDYAVSRAADDGLAIDYRLADVRAGLPDGVFDLVLVLFGELNTFPPAEAEALLAAAVAQLAPGGAIVVELSTLEAVREKGEGRPNWQALASGLFCETPHVLLEENRWNAATRAAATLFWVVAPDGRVQGYGETLYGYDDDAYAALFAAAGAEALPAPSGWPVGAPFEGKLKPYRLARLA